MRKNYKSWMRNTLSQEVEDWKKEEDPDVDNDGCFHTTAPVIIYQVNQGLRISRTIIEPFQNSRWLTRTSRWRPPSPLS